MPSEHASLRHQNTGGCAEFVEAPSPSHQRGTAESGVAVEGRAARRKVKMGETCGGGSRGIARDAEGPVLETLGLHVGYGDLAVIRGIDMSVRPGEVIAILGPNGVGKTTLLLALAGVLQPLKGEVRLRQKTTRAPLHKRAQAGLAFVSEDRLIIKGLTTRDNLRLGNVKEKTVTSHFPELEPLLTRRAGLLSGGEQQMLSVGRAIGRSPDVLIIDELSQGLAPKVINRLLEALRQAAENGTAVVMVEQSVQRCLAIADRFYFLKQGHVALEGDSASYADNVRELEDMYIAD
jgi:branched-chain amino acid transport system ATP-binding protein